jgi:oligopeptide transport system substrate-binding protein
MYYLGWVADYPHPQNFLEILFRTGEDNNAGEYSNPSVDDILNRAGVELDYATSLALYQEAEQMMVEDAACIPLWFPKNYYLVKPYVSGYELTPMGYAELSKVSVERD